MDQIYLFIASFIANTLSAFAGGGAGLVQFPALIFLGLPFSIALATHKTATVALGLGATYRHLRGGDNQFNWHFALYTMLCGVSGTVVGAWIIVQTPESLAQITLGGITVGLGIYSLYKKNAGLEEIPRNRTVSGYSIGGLVLFLIGVFNGSLSSGSGLFVTMWLIHWFGLDYKKSVMYTMTLVGIFWNATGAMAVHMMGQNIYWPWMPALLVGSLLGGYAGAHFSILKGNLWIKRIFVVLTFVSGMYLITKGFS